MNRRVGFLLVVLAATAQAADADDSCGGTVIVRGHGLEEVTDSMALIVTDSKGTDEIESPHGAPIPFTTRNCGKVLIGVAGRRNGFYASWSVRREVELRQGAANEIELDVPGRVANLRIVSAADRRPREIAVEAKAVEDLEGCFSEWFFSTGVGQRKAWWCPGGEYRVHVRHPRATLSINGVPVHPEDGTGEDSVFRVRAVPDEMQLEVVIDVESELAVRVEREQVDVVERSAIYVDHGHSRPVRYEVPWEETVRIPVDEFPVTVRPSLPGAAEIEFDPAKRTIGAETEDVVTFKAKRMETSTLRGRLIGEDLSPAELNVSWKRCGERSGKWLPGVHSDEDGEFEVACRPGCPFRVSVPAIGSYRSTLVFEEAADCESVLEIELEQALRLAGTVVDSEGRPVAGQRLQFRGGHAVTAADGTFESRRARPGSLQIRTADDDGGQWVVADRATGGPAEYEMPEDRDLTVELVRYKGGRFCATSEKKLARLVTKPADHEGRGQAVYVHDEPCTPWLVPGMHRLYASFEGDWLPRWWPDSGTERDGEMVAVPEGGEVELSFETEPAGRVKLAGWFACIDPSRVILCEPTEEPTCRELDVYASRSRKERPITVLTPVGTWDLTFIEEASEDTEERTYEAGRVEVAQGEEIELEASCENP